MTPKSAILRVLLYVIESRVFSFRALSHGHPVEEKMLVEYRSLFFIARRRAGPGRLSRVGAQSTKAKGRCEWLLDLIGLGACFPDFAPDEFGLCLAKIAWMEDAYGRAVRRIEVADPNTASVFQSVGSKHVPVIDAIKNLYNLPLTVRPFNPHLRCLT